MKMDNIVLKLNKANTKFIIRYHNNNTMEVRKSNSCQSLKKSILLMNLC